MRALSLSLSLLFATSSLAAPLAVGDTAPAFSLPTQDGKPLALKDLKGKWVVLYFYPKDFTGGCTLEAHNFEKDLPEYVKRDAVIVGVSTQDEKSHKEFCVKEGLSFKLLADVDGKVSKSYEAAADMMVTVFAKRHTFLIDGDGKVQKVYRDVDPASHSAQVLKDLDALKKTPSTTTPPTTTTPETPPTTTTRPHKDHPGADQPPVG